MNVVPPGWATASVGDVAELADGPFGSHLKTAHYTEDGPRVVRLQNIGEGTFRDERAHIAQEHYEQLVKHAVRPGDIVAASLGGEAPRACLVPSWLGPAIVKADCIRIRTFDGIESAFLMWMLNSPPVRAQASSSIKGVGRPRLGLGRIRQLDIPLPPLNEQRRIVAAIEEQFSHLDAASANLRRIELRSEAMRRSVLDAAFAPVDRVRRLGDLAETQLGKMLSAKSRTGVGTRPYLRNKNVQWGRIDLDDVLEMDFSERDIQKFSLRPGDVLVCEGGDVGRSAIWHGGIQGCCYQKALHRVRVGDQLLPDYLLHVMRWLADRNAFDPYVTGSTIRHLPQEDLRLISIPAPSIAKQRRIVADVEARLSPLDGVLDAVENAKRRSSALRRAILERAFRGELVAADPADEPAPLLLARIASERRMATPKRRKKVIA
jgi:type I restriction enzyme S subunit